MTAKLRLVAVFTLVASLVTIPSAASAAVADCNGLAPTIVGTAGDDVIDGTSGDDVILAKGGADIVNGKGGNDTICGNGGDDELNGGGGDDTILGQAGSDTIKGGGGSDSVRGGSGSDTIFGNKGPDDLRGNGGADVINGNGGIDFLHGGAGADTLSGGAGADELTGRGNSDTLNGGTGDDLVRGNKGDDVLNGDAGNDDIRGGLGDDLLNGGDGTDIANGGQDVDQCFSSETVTNCEVDDLNDAPTAQDDALTTDEDTAVAANVLVDNGAGADSDPNGDTLTVTAVNGDAGLVGVPVALGSGVEVTVAADGSLSYDPAGVLDELDDLDEVIDTLSYTISDGEFSDDADVTITVSGVNDAPIAGDDVAEVDEDASVDVDVLDNDSDVDGDELSVESFTQGTNGVVTENEDGTLNYAPNENYNGPDSFTYVVTDGDLTNTATVTIGVAGVNDAPVADDDVAEVDEDGTVDVDVLDNDSDVDGDELSVESFTQGTNGVVSLNEDGTLNYTPNKDYNGPDSFTYVLTDGELTDEATVSITVNSINDAPIAGDDTAEVDEDSSVIIDVLDNDEDVDGDELSVESFTQGTNGVVTENEDGTLTYTPNENFNGNDSFTYVVTDGDLTNTATVTIGVAGVNDAPVAVDDDAEVDEDSSVIVDVVDNDTDVDGDELSVESFTQGTNGVVTENEDGTLTYTPNENYNGDDSFTYVVTDGELTDEATVSITVNSVNDAPVAVDDDAEVDEDSSVIIDVVDDDTDVDGDVLSVESFTQGTNGVVTENEDGTLTYTPSENFNGEDSFEYTVTDGDLTDTATVTITVAGVNDAPVAVDDDADVDEDSSVDVDVVDNDTDVDGDVLSVDSFTQGTNGVVTLNKDGTLNYAPNENYNGSDSFTYVVTDGELTDEATVSITVTAVNDAPVAVDDDAEVDEDSSVIVDVVDNDTDVDGDELTPVIGEVPDGTAEVNEDGTVTFTPDPDFFGGTSFTYTADDGNGGVSEVATVSITVNPVSDAPVAEDDELEAFEDDESVSGNLFDDNGNGEDFDVDGDTLTIVEVNGFAVVGSHTEGLGNGTIEVFANGDYIFTPSPLLDFLAAGATLTDTFTYVVDDGTALTDDATVAVTLIGENDDPVAGDDPAEEGDPYVTDEDTSIVLSDLLDNDTDVDLVDTLTIDAVDETSDAGAAVSINEDGTVTYDPSGLLDSIPVDTSVIDTFEYAVGDGNGGSDIGLVTVIVNGVNDTPIAEDDQAEVTEDGPAIIIAALENDSDPDDGETATLDITGVQVLDPIGLITLLPDNTIQYDPNGQFEALHDDETATEEIGYIVVDVHGASASATATVTITGINEPWDAVNDDVEVAEDSFVNIAVLDNDVEDEEGDTPTVTIVPETGPTNGTVEVANNVVTYTPNGDYNGPDSFDYQVDDGFGGTDTATVSITVNPVEDGPVAEDDPDAVTDEDTPVEINVLANDSDPDDDELTVTEATDPPNGSVVIDELSGLPVYTPDEDFNGEDSFDYTITDSTSFATATVTVTVNPVNDAPVAEDDPDAETNEDTPVEIDVLLNDSDVDEDVLTVTEVTDPPNGSVVIDEESGLPVYTPGEDFNGEDSFGYTITDGELTDTATVTVTVNPVNDAPVAEDDPDAVTDEDTPVEINVLLNDSDVDEDKLTVTEATDPLNGSVVIDEQTGLPVYTPDEDFNGEDSFDYTITDGLLTDTATVTVTVNAVNDAPDAVDDEGSLDEDSGSVTVDVLFNDSDVDEDPIFLATFTQGANGVVTENEDSSFSYTPAEDFNGEDSFTYTITDGLLFDTATVTITVNPVNDAPVAVADSDETDEDVAVDIDVLFNDSDIDEDELTPVIVTQPTNGTAAVVDTEGGPMIRYTPNEHYNGPDSFTYKANDGTADSNTVTVDVTVNAVNDAPVAVTDEPAVGEDDGDTPIDVLTNDTDVENDPLSVVGVDDEGTTGVVTFLAGAVSYDPDGQFESLDDGETATDSFGYTVSDGDLTGDGVVDVTINGANDAPVAVDDSGEGFRMPTGAASFITGNVLDNDFDVDVEPFDVEDVSDPLGTVTYLEDGTFQYFNTAGLTDGQTDSWTYTIDDGTALSNTATVTIVINTVPVANDDPSAETSECCQTDEDTVLNQNGVLDNDTDVDGDALTVLEVNGDAGNVGVEITLTSGALLTVAADGTFVYNPNGQFEGLDTGESDTDSFTYTADDGFDGTDTATVTVTINGKNDAPVMGAETYAASIDENAAVDTPVVTVSATDIDVETLTFSIDDVGVPFKVSSGGVISVDGPLDHETTDSYSLTVRVTDGDADDTATVNVTVNDLNEAPVANDDGLQTNEDTDIVGGDLFADNGSGVDSDVDAGDSFTITVADGLTTFPAEVTLSFGTATVGSDGSISVALTQDANGVDSFGYTISDGDLTDTATVTITVNAVNDAPELSAETYNVSIDENLADGAAVVSTPATDVDGPSASYSITAGNDGSFEIDGSGNITVVNPPGHDFETTDPNPYVLTVQVSDQHPTDPKTDTATVNVTINDVP